MSVLFVRISHKCLYCLLGYLTKVCTVCYNISQMSVLFVRISHKCLHCLLGYLTFVCTVC